MALLHNPSVVTSGLVLAVDPANQKSYRENLMLYSQDVTQSSWGRTSVTVTSGFTAPDGTSTAQRFYEDNTNSYHLLSQTITCTATTYTVSVYVKAGEKTRGYIQIINANNVYVDFDLTTGTYITSGLTAQTTSKTITYVGNGWYRVSATGPVAAGATTVYLVMLNASGSAVYTGDNLSGMFMWGAQVNDGSGAAPYTPTTTAAVAKTLNDTSGNSVSGTCTDTTFSAIGGGSLTFNGSTSRILTTAVSGITGNGSWTMSVWANVDSLENGAGRQGWLLWNFSSLTTNTLITMGINGGSIEVAHYSNDFVYTSAPVSFGSWSQYTVTYDGITESVYVNGIFKQSRATGPFTIPVTGTWYFGTSQAPGGAADFLKFNSGVTQIYNRALSAAEVARNFSAHRSRYGV